MKSLANAISWGYTGTIFKILSQFLTQIILLRAIGPHGYGSYAAAYFILTLGTIVSEMGVTAAVIHAEKVNDRVKAGAFTQSIICAFFVGVIMYVFSPLASLYFNDAYVGELVKWFALVPLLQAPSNVAVGLLRRSLDIKNVQICQLIGYLVGFSLVGITLASLNWGAMSLVFAWFAQTSVTSLIAMRMAGLNFKLMLLDKSDYARVVYGWKVLATNVMNWIVENLGMFMIGRIFGAYSLGLYSATYQFVKNPTVHLINTVQTISLPATRSHADDPIWIKKFVLMLVLVLSSASAFIFGLLSALAKPVVALVFGSKWAGAEYILAPLAIAMIFHSVMAAIGPVLWGRDKVGTEFKVQFYIAIIMACALFALAQTNIVYAAWAISAILALRCVGIFHAICKDLNISIHECWLSLRGACLILLLTQLVAHFIFEYFTGQFIGSVLTSSLVLIIVMMLFSTKPKFFLASSLLGPEVKFPKWIPAYIVKQYVG